MSFKSKLLNETSGITVQISNQRYDDIKDKMSKEQQQAIRTAKIIFAELHETLYTDTTLREFNSKIVKGLKKLQDELLALTDEGDNV